VKRLHREDLENRPPPPPGTPVVVATLLDGSRHAMF
jgi:hypothetical protein